MSIKFDKQFFTFEKEKQAETPEMGAAWAAARAENDFLEKISGGDLGLRSRLRDLAFRLQENFLEKVKNFLEKDEIFVACKLKTRGVNHFGESFYDYILTTNKGRDLLI